MSKALEDRVTDLEDYSKKLKSYIHVAVLVAVVFGLGGGWGLILLNKASEKIEELNTVISATETRINTLESKVGNVDGQFEGFKKHYEVLFAEFVDTKKVEYSGFVEVEKILLQDMIASLEPKVAGNRKAVDGLRELIRKHYVHWGNKIHLRNEQNDRCIEVDPSKTLNVRLSNCKDGTFTGQNWMVQKR